MTASRIFRSVMIIMAAVLAASPVGIAQPRKAQPPNALRLYVFDCGRLDIPDVTPYQLKKEDIGLIEVKDFFSFVAVRKTKVPNTLQLIKNEKIKNKKVKIVVAK